MDDNYKIAKILLAKGAGVGLVDGDLWAPLHVACSCAGQDLVLLLLEVCVFVAVSYMTVRMEVYVSVMFNCSAYIDQAWCKALSSFSAGECD